MELRKEGESGRRKITQYTRYGTVALAVVQSFAAAGALDKGGLTLVHGFGVPVRGHDHHDHRHACSSCGSVSRSPSAASATASR